MRKIIYLLLCLTSSVLARAQGNGAQLTYRFWIDQDTQVQTVTDGPHLVYQLPVGDLPGGMHELHIQALDGEGRQSVAETRLFYKQGNIQAGEKIAYWFDEDQQSGGTLDGARVATEIDVSHLIEGIHQIHFVSVGEQVSQVETMYFVIMPLAKTETSMHCIVLIDNQVYKQEELPLQDGRLACMVDVNALEPGVHNMQVIAVTRHGTSTQVADAWFMRANTTTDLTTMKCYYTIDGNMDDLREGTYSNGTYHLDLDVSALSDGLHNIMYVMKADNGVTTNVNSAFFVKTPVGGNGVTSYDYWVNDEAEPMKVTLNERHSTLSLYALLPVSEQPLRTSQFHFAYKDGQPYIFAKNDFHVRFYDVSQYYTTQSAVYVDENVAQAVEDVTPLVSGEAITRTKPAAGEIHWYSVTVATGDSLTFWTDKACTMQAFAPSGEEVYSASGKDAAAPGGFHARENGTYYLALHDATASSDEITLRYEHIDRYVLFDCTPREIGGKPQSRFRLHLFGNGYDKLKHATLKMAAERIEAHTIEATDMSHATLHFTMPAAPVLGVYDLLLDFEDEEGEASTLATPQAVTIAEPVEGAIAINIKSYPRTAKPYPVYVTVTNTGNVMVEDIDLRVGHQTSDKILSTTFDNSELKPIGEYTDSNMACKDMEGNVYIFQIPYISGRNQKTIEAGFVADAHTKFYMTAWQYDQLQPCPDGAALAPIDVYMPGDPNEMHGYLAESGEAYIREEVKDVYYRIEFENDTTLANAAAHHIVITDQLDGTKLDLQSFRPTSVMFGGTSLVLDGTEQSFVKTVDMRPAVNALAQVSLDYNAQAGIAVWDILSLDPMTLEPTDDAMMGILSVGGMGEVTFDISLRDGLPNGTRIDNKATITFDQEAAIETPVFTNTTDYTLPVSSIDATLEGDSVTLSIEGSDTGSGIWHYNVYQQQSATGIWTKVAEDVEHTTLTLPIPVDSRDYGFCVIATDKAGNVEDKELHREVSFRDMLTGDANGDGEVDITDAVTIVNYVVTHNAGGIDMNAADMNRDGEVDITDAVMIVNALTQQQ